MISFCPFVTFKQMSIRHFIYGCLLFIISGTKAYSQKWKQLNDSLVYYFNAGDYPAAFILAEKCINIAELEFGKDHGNYAISLSNLASLHESSGNYESAEPFYKEALKINKKLLGTDHPNYASSLNNLGLLYFNMGKYAEAEPLYKEAISIRKKSQGEKNPEYATSLNNLAALYERMGNFSAAEPLYLEAAKIDRIVLGDEHPDYATDLNNLAGFYKNKGSYEKAETLFQEALRIRKKILGETHPHYAQSLNNLATLNSKMGDYSMAESLFKQAMQIRKKVVGEEHPLFASSLNNLAALYQDQGNYNSAEPLYEKALLIRKNTLGKEHPQYAVSLNNLAGLYEKTGNYARAEPLYLEALDIRKKTLGTKHPEYASSLNSLAGLYKEIGKFSQAEILYSEAINIIKSAFGEMHPEYSVSLNNLAGFYTVMGQHKKAEELYKLSIQIDKINLGVNHPDYASGLNNLASLYEKMGDEKEAVRLYGEALGIRKKILGENHPEYASSLNNLAFLYCKLGQYDSAESLYQSALLIRKEVLGEYHPDYAATLINLALLYNNTKQYKLAEPLLIRGALISFGHLMTNFTNLSEKEKQSWLEQSVYVNDLLLSLQYHYKALSDTARRLILDQQLLLKSFILSDSKTVLQIIQNSSDSSLQNDYAAWLSIKKSLSSQYSLPNQLRHRDLSEWERRAEVIEKQLNSKSAALRHQLQSYRVNSRDLQKSLKKGEAAIEFLRFNLYSTRWTDSIVYAAYLLTAKDTVPVFIPLCEESRLQKIFDSAGTTATSMVSRFYRGTEIKNKSSVSVLGRELYHLIWEPLEPYLNGVKTISYSPAGKLFSIAFHALPADSTHLLMDQYKLNQYTSTRQIAISSSEIKTSPAGPFTLFGDAAFTIDSLEITKSKTGIKSISNIYTPQHRGAKSGTWTSLPGTALEIKKIKQVFDQYKLSSQTFTQKAASEENLKSLSWKAPQVLHIATHGFFLPETDSMQNRVGVNYSLLADDPLLRSGLILSGGNYAWSGKTPIEGVEDGIVTAYEISQLNLSNTELVVLSACETALGDVKGSEGVFGLQRAFKMAGVKKLIVSLWQVPDKETAELMTAFYGYWLGGKKIEDAFSQAQSDMRKKYPPYYWAAFVLVE